MSQHIPGGRFLSDVSVFSVDTCTWVTSTSFQPHIRLGAALRWPADNFDGRQARGLWSCRPSSFFGSVGRWIRKGRGC